MRFPPAVHHILKVTEKPDWGLNIAVLLDPQILWQVPLTLLDMCNNGFSWKSEKRREGHLPWDGERKREGDHPSDGHRCTVIIGFSLYEYRHIHVFVRIKITIISQEVKRYEYEMEAQWWFQCYDVNRPRATARATEMQTCSAEWKYSTYPLDMWKTRCLMN